MKRVVIVVVVLAVLGVGAFVVYQRLTAAQVPAAASVPTAAVTRGTLSATVNAGGNIAARQVADLSFGQSGVVERIHVKVGDRVQPGQVLAETNTADLKLQLRNSQVSLNVAQAKLAQAKNPTTSQDIATSRARLASAQAAYAKVTAGPSQTDLATAQAQLASAQAAYDAAVKSAGAPNSQMTSAASAFEKARLALETAQGAYDKVAWRGDVAGSSQAQALQTATIDYETAKTSYESLLATSGADANTKLVQARSQLEQAQANLTKVKNQVTEADVASAQASLIQAQNDLDKLLAGPDAYALDIAQNGVEQAQIALEQTQLRLQQAQVVAPFAGVVTAVNVRLGQNASGNAIQIADLDHLEIVVNMSEVDVNRVKVGQSAEVSLDALADAVLQGSVTQIAPAGVQSQGVVNYPVTVALTDPPAGAKTGMTANLSIIVEQRQNALMAPNRAVRSQGRQRTATVLFEGLQMPVTVQTGLSNDTMTEITSGLKEGDMVVLGATTTAQTRVGVPGIPGGFVGGPGR